MIFDGALAANGIFSIGSWVWCVIIGALIVLWIQIGIRNLGKVNTAAMAALFVLTIVLSFVIFGKGNALNISGDGMTFGAAVELSVAMPLSWLPLISDYTREAKKPVKASAASAITYGIVSCWMYVIGMGAAIFTAESDIAQIMVKAGLGIAGLLIVVFSTVTTTFLDAHSAGISSESLSGKTSGKLVAVVVTIIGTRFIIHKNPGKSLNSCRGFHLVSDCDAHDQSNDDQRRHSIDNDIHRAQRDVQLVIQLAADAVSAHKLLILGGVIELILKLDFLLSLSGCFLHLQSGLAFGNAEFLVNRHNYFLAMYLRTSIATARMMIRPRITYCR